MVGAELLQVVGIVRSNLQPTGWSVFVSCRGTNANSRLYGRRVPTRMTATIVAIGRTRAPSPTLRKRTPLTTAPTA